MRIRLETRNGYTTEILEHGKFFRNNGDLVHQISVIVHDALSRDEVVILRRVEEAE